MKETNRKLQIIKTAAKLFKDKGYSAVTMRDLATEMGIKAASLYNHISSKQDILKTIVIAIAEEFTDKMKVISESNDTCIQKLKAIVSLHVTISSQNIYGMASLNNDWMHLEEQLDYYLKLREDYENDFRNILKEGIFDKEIKDENPEVMLFSILSTLRSLHLWIPKKEDLKVEELSETLSNVLINGVRI